DVCNGCQCNVNDTPNQGWTDHLETRALPEGPRSVGGPMRCPWYLFLRLFWVWARTQGPHDPLLPVPGSVGCPMRCPWYLFHRLF
ncbi:unnamed protein product, partial [Staurois parvus]